MIRSAFLLRLSVVVAALSACNRSRTLEVVNTSGRQQAVMVFDRSLADLYWTDSVDATHSACWHVPKFARDEHVVLIVAPILTESEMAGVLPRPRAWTDSVVLDRSWALRIRAASGAAGRVERNESSACR